MIRQLSQRIKRHIGRRRPLSARLAELGRRPGLIILCYHSVGDEPADYPYTLSADAFEQQLRLLGEAMEFADPHVAFDRLAGNRQGSIRSEGAMPVRAQALVTFDDGYRNNLDVATPILEKLGVRAALFATRNFIEEPNTTYLDRLQLKALHASGCWALGAHTVSHASLPSLLDDDVRTELTRCRSWLEDLIGEKVGAVAYPHGKSTARVREIARSCYELGFATQVKPGAVLDDPFRIPRVVVNQSTTDPGDLVNAMISAPLFGSDDLMGRTP